jgi:hypothetical protein
MTTSVLSVAGAILTSIRTLFEEKPPVLVEVRFPMMGTSSDWFLCDDMAALDVILGRLGPGAEVHLASVWDLKKPAGAIVFRTNKPADTDQEKDKDKTSPTFTK